MTITALFILTWTQTAHHPFWMDNPWRPFLNGPPMIVLLRAVRKSCQSQAVGTASGTIILLMAHDSSYLSYIHYELSLEINVICRITWLSFFGLWIMFTHMFFPQFSSNNVFFSITHHYSYTTLPSMLYIPILRNNPHINRLSIIKKRISEVHEITICSWFYGVVHPWSDSFPIQSRPGFRTTTF